MDQEPTEIAMRDDAVPAGDGFVGKLHARSSRLELAALVERIRHGDSEASVELYIWLRRVMIWQFFSSRLTAQGVEDEVHEAFVIVVSAIRDGKLNYPDRLLGFAGIIARRRMLYALKREIAGRIQTSSIGDPEQHWEPTASTPNPEELVFDHERVDVMRRSLAVLSERQREILERFYMHEQSHEQICEEMSLTHTQFRLLKSRAKAKAAKIAGKRHDIHSPTFHSRPGIAGRSASTRT